jgi:dihydrolipoamide dehydrogenase
MAAMAVGSTNDFDLVVLGGGTGGYSAAFRASQYGLKVALVEKEKIGGVCLHIGCIPAKALLESAEFYRRVKDHAAELGVTVGEPGIDYPAMSKRRDTVVERLHKGLQSLVKKNKVTYFAGTGRLDGARNVAVKLNEGGDIHLRGTDVILASGSRVKSLPGLETDGKTIVTSDDLLRLDRTPKSIAIVGGGAVGVEFASLYADLGIPVTLLEYLPTLVPLEDAELGKELERSFKRRGVKVMTNARFDASRVSREDGGICLMAGPEGGEQEEVRAEMLLVAVGRAPNTDQVGLESTRAKKDQRGFVETDAHMKTAEPHLYAIGDIVPSFGLAHVAAHEGITAVERIVEPDPSPIDYTAMPRVTFCRPQVATLGWSEQECAEKGIEVKVGKFPYLANGKALIGGDYEGFAKVIARKSDDQLLGVHMIGPHVTDFISEASVAKLLDASAWEIGAAVHPHPTLAEALGEAAMAVDGRAINF